MPRLKSAPPPIHSVALVGGVAAICFSSLPSLESIDEVATMDTFTRNVLARTGNGGGMMVTLAAIRLFIATIVFGVSLKSFLTDRWLVKTTYLSKSKLEACTLDFTRIWTQMGFSQWSWNLLGWSFLINGAIPLLAASGKEEVLLRNRWILRMAFLCFETVAPTTLLTTLVVTYGIWPTVLREEGPEETAKGLATFTLLMQHNMNLIFVLIEVAFLGNLPVRSSDTALGPLLGVLYVVVAWFMSTRWPTLDGGDHGPQYLYFFLDTTLGPVTTLSLVVLLAVLLSSHLFFSWLAFEIGLVGCASPQLVVGMVVFCAFACRFRD